MTQSPHGNVFTNGSSTFAVELAGVCICRRQVPQVEDVRHVPSLYSAWRPPPSSRPSIGNANGRSGHGVIAEAVGLAAPRGAEGRVDLGAVQATAFEGSSHETVCRARCVYGRDEGPRARRGGPPGLARQVPERTRCHRSDHSKACRPRLCASVLRPDL